jgi:membrane protein
VNDPASSRLTPDSVPLWATVLTAALLWLGFTRPRYAAASRQSDTQVPHARFYEHDRGRLAKTPSEIPARGWKDVLWRIYGKIGEDRIMLVAAGTTFYSLLAIFPAIAALVAIYGLFADPTSIAAHLDSLSGIFPGGALDVIRDQMNRVAAQGRGTLGATFIIGLAVSLWSANAAVKSLFDALNLVYEEREKRGLVRLNLISLAFTTGGIVFVLLAIGAMIVLPIVLGYLGFAQQTALLVKILRWPALLVVVAFALALLYRFGPSRERPRWRWITWGSAFAAIGWLVVSLLFSWYAQNFGSYNATYGSLGAVIGFMIWMWLSAMVVLIGAELDAEMEHQTARDTTTGAPKPLGARGAKMADTVGSAQD